MCLAACIIFNVCGQDNDDPNQPMYKRSNFAIPLVGVGIGKLLKFTFYML